MKISTRKQIGLVLTLIALIPVGIWDLMVGDIGYGVGIIAGAIGAAVSAWFNIKKIKTMEAQGIEVYDERVIQVAGLAARGALTLFLVGLALFVGLGAVLGPIVKVNPYNFAGILLTIGVLLYVGLFSYHNRRL